MKPSNDKKNDLSTNEKALLVFFVSLAILLLVAFSLGSCNVTRTVTTTAQHFQRGDTTVTIMTKTTESYDGAVKRDNFFK